MAVLRGMGYRLARGVAAVSAIYPPWLEDQRSPWAACSPLTRSQCKSMFVVMVLVGGMLTMHKALYAQDL